MIFGRCTDNCPACGYLLKYIKNQTSNTLNCHDKWQNLMFLLERNNAITALIFPVQKPGNQL